jgi:hypothetical protein
MSKPSSSPSTVRVPVMVNRTIYNELKSFSEVTGVPVARLVQEALEDFRATSLQARLDALTIRRVQ